MAKPIKPKKQIAFNVLEGQFDLVTGNNFSYRTVPADKKLKIRDNEQMVLHGCMEVDGMLEIEGIGMLVVEE